MRNDYIACLRRKYKELGPYIEITITGSFEKWKNARWYSIHWSRWERGNQRSPYIKRSNWIISIVNLQIRSCLFSNAKINHLEWILPISIKDIFTCIYLYCNELFLYAQHNELWNFVFWLCVHSLVACIKGLGSFMKTSNTRFKSKSPIL